jgi:DNA-directed RNA polymerase subunit H (RpoH/RPB5)
MDYVLHGANLGFLLMQRGYLKDADELVKLLGV